MLRNFTKHLHRISHKFNENQILIENFNMFQFFLLWFKNINGHNSQK